MLEVKPKKKGQTKTELLRKLKEMEAQMTSSYHFASAGLDKATYPALMGTALIIEMTALGGRELMRPVAIRGGLSQETIDGLRKDIARSYDEAVEFKPVKVALP